MGIFQQFPYSNFHEMNLDQIIKIMREMQDEWENTKSEWASYKEFIDNYFENLDVSAEVLEALRVMAESGELNTLIDPVIVTETIAWLADHITQPTTPVVDTSLSIAGAAADAKVTGDRLNWLDGETALIATPEKFIDASMKFEQGSMGATGLNIPGGTARMRSVGYFDLSNKVTEAIVVRFSVKNAETVNFVINWYDANDFVTPRIGYTNWSGVNGELVWIPVAARYCRLLVKYVSEADIVPEDFNYFSLQAGNILPNVDLDNIKTTGTYNVSGANCTNVPESSTEPRMLDVFKIDNGAVIQRLTYTLSGNQFVRLYGTDSVWRPWAKSETEIAEIVSYIPFPHIFKFKTEELRAHRGGCIAMYNNVMFNFDGGKIFFGSTEAFIENGHGNNCQFGVTLHGSYPYLYCPSWNKDQGDIFVNQINNDNTTTLIRTIHYNLTGYLNACVDEAADRIYIFLCTSNTPYEGDTDFIVSDLNGSIISSTTLDIKIPVIQDMKCYNDIIYMVAGDSVSYPNTYYTFDTTGKLISKSAYLTIPGEIEGIELYGDTLYMADQDNLYKSK